MVDVSIICLIYKSTKLMDAVYESAMKYTPKLKTGEAEFLFVANDPTDYVVTHLIEKKYSFIICKNKHYSEEELFKMGYGLPEYINRVYKGYSQGILHARGNKVVLINSDNFFSDNWLENLLKHYDFKRIIDSQLVERNHEKFGVFPGAIEKNFGDCIENYKDSEFNNFANSIKREGLKEGGAYMPCLLSRDMAIHVGLYPGGNIAGKRMRNIKRFGDQCFYDKLNSIGVKHYTSLDSIVYHLKEGEREEENKGQDCHNCNFEEYVVRELPTFSAAKYRELFIPFLPDTSADLVIDKILFEISVFKKLKKSVKDFFKKIFAACVFDKKEEDERVNLKFFGIIKISLKKK